MMLRQASGAFLAWLLVCSALAGAASSETEWVEFWVYEHPDSTTLVDDSYNAGCFAYACEGDTAGTTIDAVYADSTVSWVFINPPRRSYRVEFESDSLNVIVKHCVRFGGRAVAAGEIDSSAAFAAKVVSSEALADTLLQDRHFSETHAYTLTLSDSAFVPTGALPEVVMLDEHFAGMLADHDSLFTPQDTLEANGGPLATRFWLEETAKPDSFRVNFLVPGDSALVTIPGLAVGDSLYLGSLRWDDGQDSLRADVLEANGIGDTKIDFSSLTVADFSFDPPLAQGKLWVGSMGGLPVAQTMGGDHVMDSDGRVSHDEDAVDTDDLKDANSPTENYIAAYTATKQIRWHYSRRDTTTFRAATSWKKYFPGAEVGDHVSAHFAGDPPAYTIGLNNYAFQLGFTVSDADSVEFWYRPQRAASVNAGAEIEVWVYRVE